MKPTLHQLLASVHRAGRLLGTGRATYCFEGRFKLDLGADWALVISADYAGRFRLEACRSGRVLATMWCAAGDQQRFDDLVLSARAEVAELVG
jgi:hypothetical protein